MRNRAFKRKLIHRCTIKRPPSDRNSRGEPTPGVTDDWGDVAVDQACLYIEKENKPADEQISQQQKMIRMLLLPGGVDAQTKDRVIGILDTDGVSVAAGPLDIEERIARNGHKPGHHITLILEQVK